MPFFMFVLDKATILQIRARDSVFQIPKTWVWLYLLVISTTILTKPWGETHQPTTDGEATETSAMFSGQSETALWS